MARISYGSDSEESSYRSATGYASTASGDSSGDESDGTSDSSLGCRPDGSGVDCESLRSQYSPLDLTIRCFYSLW